MIGGDNIRVKTIHMKCCECGEELYEGTKCYDHMGDIYCKDCWETYLEKLTDECEIEAEDDEEWS